MATGWDVTSAVGSFAGGLAGTVAAIVAAAQLRYSRVDESRRGALEGLFRIEERVRDLFATGTSVAVAQADVLARYRGQAATFSPGAQAYLNLLTLLDIVAIGVSANVIDRKLAMDYLCTLLDDDDMISLSFLNDIQQCCDDSNTYRHLRKLLLARRVERDRDVRGRL